MHHCVHWFSRALPTGPLLALALLATACGGSSGGGTTAADLAAPTATDGGGAADLAGGGDAAAGGNGISGSVNGARFDGAATALWIGAADDPATTVVYVFDRAVACADLAMMGWDTRIPDGTQVLEMKMFGTSPGSFAVTASLTPAMGEATVNYTLSKRMGTPTEVSGATGQVVLSTRTAMKSATGTFDIHFGGGDKLAGRYDAAFCPGGHEP